MSDRIEFLTCSCNGCGQKLEFASDCVGAEIKCPTCGKPVKLFEFPREHRKTPPAVPIPPPLPFEEIKLPFNLPCASGPQMHLSPPLEVPKKDNARVRNLLFVLIALILAIAMTSPLVFLWQKRERKVEQLKNELRLLEAQVQTGVNYNDFLTQVARVRAAHLTAIKVLSQEQELRYTQLDRCIVKCSEIWNPNSFYHKSSTFDADRVFSDDEARFGVKFDLRADAEYGFDIYHGVVPKLFNDRYSHVLGNIVSNSCFGMSIILPSTSRYGMITIVIKFRHACREGETEIVLRR